MSHRELVVLGTSSQVPTRYRNHNGYLLLWDGHGVLFDPGEGTQRQMTLAEVRAHQITHVCVTHFHGDHCLGLPGILQRISLDEVPHPVFVHYPSSGQVYFDRLRRASIYKDKADIQARPHEGAGCIGQYAPFELHTAPLQHGVPAWGYRLVEPDGFTMDGARLRELGVRGPAIGQIQREGQATLEDGRVIHREDVAARRPGQVVTFLMDTAPCDAAIELSRGADLLICESTYLAEHTAEAHDHGHLTAEDAGKIAAQASVGTLVLTHFSQRYPMNAPFVAQAKRHFDGEVIAATDLLRVPVPPRRGAP